MFRVYRKEGASLVSSSHGKLGRIHGIVLAAGILAGCGSPKPLPAKLEPLDPWVLKSANLESPASPWLSNGNYGYRIDLQKGLAEVFSSTSYNPQGEEKLESSSAPLNPITKSMVRSEQASLDLRTGVLQQSWTAGEATEDVQFVVSSDGKLIRQTFKGAGEPTYSWIGGPKRTDPTYGAKTAFRQSEAENKAAWSTDIEIDGPVEDQQAIRSFLFYLRMAVPPNGKMSVAPYALSSNTYFGHIFWDADLWVFPALCFLDPARARAIPQYRLRMLPQAQKNFSEWLNSGRPTGGGNLGPADSGVGIAGAKFPWESSVSGKETVPGPSKFQDHVTGSVAWSVRHAEALGLVGKTSLLSLAGSFYALRSEAGPNGRELKGTMSPDEFHTGDNDLYTNLLAEWCMNAGRFANTPQPLAGKLTEFKLPRDKVSFLTYDNDQLQGYKQAAAVLAIYPLQYPPAENQALTMLDRFENKVTPNGPAMTDSIHAIIRARFGDADAAYKTWHNSWKPFTDHGLMLFSEKRKKASTYFVTGAAGSLQAVIYGFLGFRIDYKTEPGAVWTKQLKGGYWLSIKPNLPPAWKKVTFKNFHVLGKRYTLTATHDSVSVTQGEP